MYVQLQHLNQSTWTCITTRQAINAPNFAKCEEWAQEGGCPLVVGTLPTPSMLQENMAPANNTRAERMRTQSFDNEEEDEEFENDSVDDMMEELRNTDQRMGNRIMTLSTMKDSNDNNTKIAKETMKMIINELL